MFAINKRLGNALNIIEIILDFLKCIIMKYFELHMFYSTFVLKMGIFSISYTICHILKRYPIMLLTIRLKTFDIMPTDT